MKLKNLAVLPAVLLLLSALAAAQIDPPKLTPVPSTERQEQLIREGVALHDAGKYAEAAAKYEEVLKENPDNVGAIYEQSFSHYLKKDLPKAAELARRGARYKSPLLPRFYVLIANVLDEQSEPEQAVKVYKSGLKLNPEESLLHFNLAVTYDRMKKPEEARESVKQALLFNPAHPTSHLLLAALYKQGNYRIPALLAAARFLVLEPATARADMALGVVREMQTRGVQTGKNENEINVIMDASPPKEEGDFASLDLMLSLARAGRKAEEKKDKNEIQLLVDDFELIFSTMGDGADAKKRKFVGGYYMPYFGELKKRGFVEPFVYHAFQRSGLPGVAEWLADHRFRVQSFLTWSKNYQWPKQVDD
jgi:tetratricopeptide (TPR) repeat protein